MIMLVGGDGEPDSDDDHIAADDDAGSLSVFWWMLVAVQCVDVDTLGSASSFHRCGSVSRRGSLVSWSASVNLLSLQL